MRKVYFGVIVIIISIVLSACSEAQPENSAIESFSDEPSIVLTDESSLEPTTGEESESPEEISEVLEEESIEAQLDEEYELFTVDSENTFALLDGKFIPINEAVEPVVFEKTEISEREYDFTAEYQLYGSSEQQILVEARPTKGDSYSVSIQLIVDGIAAEIFNEACLYDVGIIDLDENDNYVEIALYLSPETDGSWISFYRYDGSNVFSLGYVSGDGHNLDDMPARSTVYVDKKGKIVSELDKIMITNPNIAAAYYQLTENTLERKLVDLTPAFGKKHSVSYELLTYGDDPGISIAITDEMPTINSMGDLDGDFTYINYKFEQNETITLLNAGTYGQSNCFTLNGDLYQIQLKDGRKGVIFYGLAG